MFYALEILAKDAVIDEGKLTACVAGFFSFNKPEEFKWTSNFYNMKHINFVCENLQIGCRIHYYDDESLNDQIRTKFLGLKSAKTIIELGLYKEHYFIWEKTKYTRYFVQHYRELKNEKDANKIIGTRANGSFRRDSNPKRYLNSLELLREMMWQNLFDEMNFKDIYELETPIDNTKPIWEQIREAQTRMGLPKGYVFNGLKKLANGDLVPDIVKKDEEDDENDEDNQLDKINSEQEKQNIHFISSDDSDDMIEEEREIDLENVPKDYQLMFLNMV